MTSVHISARECDLRLARSAGAAAAVLLPAELQNPRNAVRAASRLDGTDLRFGGFDASYGVSQERRFDLDASALAVLEAVRSSRAACSAPRTRTGPVPPHDHVCQGKGPTGARHNESKMAFPAIARAFVDHGIGRSPCPSYLLRTHSTRTSS